VDEAKPRRRLQMFADDFNYTSVEIDLYEDTTPEQVEQALIWLAGEIRKHHIEGDADWQEELASRPIVQ
jgi:hypothetical protein